MNSFLHRFLPKSNFVANTGTGTVLQPKIMRCLTIISPPEGFPKTIEWDMNDPVSMEKANNSIQKLVNGGRAFFTEDKPGTAGKRLDKPDLKEDMLCIPKVVAG